MKTHLISTTSPAAASTEVSIVIPHLDRYREVFVHGVFTGATNGSLDITLQRRIQRAADPGGAELWADWAHFTQLASTADQIKYALHGKAAQTTLAITAVGIHTTGDTPSPVLAAGEFVGGHPGDALRAVMEAGTGTEAGAPVVIYVCGIE